MTWARIIGLAVWAGFFLALSHCTEALQDPIGPSPFPPTTKRPG